MMCGRHGPKVARQLARAGCVAVLSLLVFACATGRTARRAPAPEGDPRHPVVTFQPDGFRSRQGTVEVRLGEGHHFQGVYELQGGDDYYRLWPRWQRWTAGFYGVSTYPGQRLEPPEDLKLVEVMHFPDKMHAHLHDHSRSDLMLCDLSLDQPERGLPGGALGPCTMRSGEAFKLRALPEK